MFLCDIIIWTIPCVVPFISWGCLSIPFIGYFAAFPLGAVSFVISLAMFVYSRLLVTSFYSDDSVAVNYTSCNSANDTDDNYFLNCQQYNENDEESETEDTE